MFLYTLFHLVLIIASGRRYRVTYYADKVILDTLIKLFAKVA